MDCRHGLEWAMRVKTRLTGRCAHARHKCVPGTDLSSDHGRETPNIFIGSLERVRTASPMVFQGLVLKDCVQRPSEWLLSLICTLRVLQSSRNKHYSMLPEE